MINLRSEDPKKLNSPSLYRNQPSMTIRIRIKNVSLPKNHKKLSLAFLSPDELRETIRLQLENKRLPKNFLELFGESPKLQCLTLINCAYLECSYPSSDFSKFINLKKLDIRNLMNGSHTITPPKQLEELNFESNENEFNRLNAQNCTKLKRVILTSKMKIIFQHPFVPCIEYFESNGSIELDCSLKHDTDWTENFQESVAANYVCHSTPLNRDKKANCSKKHSKLIHEEDWIPPRLKILMGKLSNETNYCN